MLKNIGIISCFLLFSSCSSIRSVALKTAAPLFMDSMAGIEAEGNWEAFKQGTPGNLTLIDGLLAVRPEDENLLVAAIKGNAGYAFGVEETLYLEDKLAENDNSYHKYQAIAYYTKAFEYGLQFLKVNDLSLDDLKMAIKDKRGVTGLLESQLSGNMVSQEAILFTAQSLGSLINLQRENIQLISHLPLVKSMFDWVCEINPEIGHGMCQIFYGSYEAGRPAMLGGNPEKGKDIFLKMIKENPHNWLARVAYVEYFALPQYDQDVYNRQKKDLVRYENLLKEELNWNPMGKKDEAFANRRLRLYQAIAIKRFQIIRKYEKEIF
jgi:hypothetical protein